MTSVDLPRAQTYGPPRGPVFYACQVCPAFGTTVATSCSANVLQAGCIGLPKKRSTKARKNDEDINKDGREPCIHRRDNTFQPLLGTDVIFKNLD